MTEEYRTTFMVVRPYEDEDTLMVVLGIEGHGPMEFTSVELAKQYAAHFNGHLAEDEAYAAKA